MDISKKIYNELTPKQRVIACFSAINRNDRTEIDRLMKTAPRNSRLYKSIRGLDQALELYTNLVSPLMIDLLQVTGQSKAALSFCVGWISAGGSEDNEEYMRNCLTAKRLSEVIDSRIVEIKEVQQAAREWCEQNEIPTDLLSGRLCNLPIPKEMEEQSESETLNTVRSVFDKITLTW